MADQHPKPDDGIFPDPDIPPPFPPPGEEEDEDEDDEDEDEDGTGDGAEPRPPLIRTRAFLFERKNRKTFDRFRDFMLGAYEDVNE
ncbi:conserved hypothetical protein [Gluconacetobacter diazotrophicus PA1 5]|uniref:Uncharacterized protein n=1 Tax=Gluconacetobacter diazotrophicus (strain ATCC 49037 / DSM 5601 / CCUG 37298 / CIP 103539 / LMG 7603 / PAl5) TaxID=272568 RepID=A9HCR7_GLUDA|nr:hypothetical protein [Gluconacetobacter diazotrophicus]ACI52254.1 conserved hypothetical protein [Gluconacetobacter diazotrophicus PA1 5]TWB00418.1 hypothetical protein FBZ86_13733 [Gluconacetobacter diazotrophicus]CAP54982.1 hypothetical protein GDI1039 [Gluconacetobacter diazotrophicus PA1 5]